MNQPCSLKLAALRHVSPSMGSASTPGSRDTSWEGPRAACLASCMCTRACLCPWVFETARQAAGTHRERGQRLLAWLPVCVRVRVFAPNYIRGARAPCKHGTGPPSAGRYECSTISTLCILQDYYASLSAIPGRSNLVSYCLIKRLIV